MNVSDAAVCPIPDDSVIDAGEVQSLVENTSNTWQPDRKAEETASNTAMGKKAEYVFACYLQQKSSLIYLPYDRFRQDNNEKHAPFDGLLFKKDTDHGVVRQCIDEINNEIRLGKVYGKLSEGLRQRLAREKLYTVEVKSSRLKDPDYENVSTDLPRTMEDRAQIVENLLRRDFFVYPRYLRKTQDIQDFFQYAEYVRKRYWEYQTLNDHDALAKLMVTEYRNASDIYTRLYFDDKANEIYIPGYILKERFFTSPKIGKMPGAKSGGALYYMHSIADRKCPAQIETDRELWDRDRSVIPEDLFAVRDEKCAYCQMKLTLRRDVWQQRFYYQCTGCNGTYEV